VAPVDPLALLQEDARLAYLRHAARPFVHGPAGEHLRLWAGLYEAKACLNEQNPAFAASLLRTGGFMPLVAPGLPVLPTGVRWAVDEEVPGTIKLAVDVAGGATFSVVPPGGTAFAPTVTGLPTRASTTFPAKADGLYKVLISVGATTLATLYIPVMRAEFRRFRENSRALAFGFRAARPKPNDPYRQRLACIIAADAAAQTGQPALYAALMADALAIEQAPSPVALYPYG
jgi:hypothetical protein